MDTYIHSKAGQHTGITVYQAKLDARKTRQQRQTQDAAELQERLPNDMRRTLKVSREKGASSWLPPYP